MNSLSFFKKRISSYHIVIGCGRLGAVIADALSAADQDVMIIDQNKEAFRRLPPSYGGQTLTGDATDFEVLKEARLEQADSVIIVTNRDNVNIMTAQLARNCFHVKKVIARLYDPERECVYQELNIDTICPALLSVRDC